MNKNRNFESLWRKFVNFIHNLLAAFGWRKACDHQQLVVTTCSHGIKEADPMALKLASPSGIYCVFPGLGKTTLADISSKYLDADFAYYRKLFLGDGEYDGDKLEAARRQYCNDVMQVANTNEFLGVLVNDPRSFAGRTTNVVMYLPKDLDYHYQQLLNREGNSEFAQAFKQYGHEWVADWEDIAKDNLWTVKYITHLGCEVSVLKED